MRPLYLIGKSVLIEAIRRKEIYAIIFVSMMLIAAVGTIHFFNIPGLTKFYRDVALKVMGVPTALTVIVLAARQLPREFERRTIYPLMAKPIGRLTFLFGKLAGVMASAAFCFLIFMLLFVAGSWYLGGSVYPGVFLQHIWLQMVMLLVVASLSMWLSLSLNLDAAITIGAIMYLFSNVLATALPYLYGNSETAVERGILVALNWAIPQLTLFDLSEKVTHSESWGAIAFVDLAAVSAYGFAWSAAFIALAWNSLRRKPL